MQKKYKFCVTVKAVDMTADEAAATIKVDEGCGVELVSAKPYKKPTLPDGVKSFRVFMEDAHGGDYQKRITATDEDGVRRLVHQRGLRGRIKSIVPAK